MSWSKGMFARLRSILGARASESRMEEEFSFHVEMETKRLIATGMSEHEARRLALVSFGGLDTHREEMRDGRGARWFNDLGADIRYALRTMRRAPGFAIAVALTLGVGIGVNGIVFGYVNSLLYRPIPARDPGQLVALFNLDTKSREPGELGYEDYVDFRDRSGAFDGLAGMTGVPLNLVVPDRATAADMVWGEIVTENFFTVLGMQPTIGRLFAAGDAAPGANPFAVLSYDSWVDRFARDPSIVGRPVRINGTEFIVTGVAPRGFKGMRTFGFWPEIWVPLGMHDVVMPGSSRLLRGRGGGWMMVVGRMHPGADRTATEGMVTRFARQLEQTYPASNTNVGAMIIPAKAGFDHPAFVKPAVMVLASALGVFAALVTLIIICANLANLQLARAAARTHETAIRLSLGCSRARLSRQMLVESLVLATPGILLAAALIRLSPFVESLMLPRLQFRVGIAAAADMRVVIVTAVVALVAITLLGLVPALRSSASLTLSRLIGAHRTSTGRPQRLRGVLVVSQLALSVVLLVGASLFARSLLLARNSDPGFDARNRALMSVNLELQGYDEARGRRFYDDVLARVRALPSVESATWGFPVPFDTYGRGISLYVDGVSARTDGTVGADASIVAEDFVRTLGLELQAGRDFATTDTAAGPQVMIVSRELATRLWPGRDPVGQRARLNSATGPGVAVVGVVGDAKFESLGPATPARAYIPLRQAYRPWETLIVHTRGAPGAVTPDIRAIVAGIDPTLPIFGVSTLEQGVESGLATSRSAAGVAGFFGLLALLISSVGLYAVVASGVAERTREIGVRMALGSTPQGVMRLVMRGGARLGFVGLVIGLAGAALVARLMASLLYGLSPADPITFVLVPLTLIVLVLVATWIPARRAVKLDPVVALRTD
jgi:predicted permease